MCVSLQKHKKIKTYYRCFTVTIGNHSHSQRGVAHEKLPFKLATITILTNHPQNSKKTNNQDPSAIFLKPRQLLIPKNKISSFSFSYSCLRFRWYRLMPSSHKFLDKSPGTFSHPLKLVEHSLVFFGCSGWAGERDPFFWSEEFRFCRLFCAWYSGRGVHETMKGSTCLTVFFSKPKQSDSFNGRSKSLKFCVIVFFWGGIFSL